MLIEIAHTIHNDDTHERERKIEATICNSDRQTKNRMNEQTNESNSNDSIDIIGFLHTYT